jgi:hypothetical protein
MPVEAREPATSSQPQESVPSLDDGIDHITVKAVFIGEIAAEIARCGLVGVERKPGRGEGCHNDDGTERDSAESA